MSSPYDSFLSEPNEGVILQELITYRIDNGMLKKITIARQFFEDDYVDTQTVEPLCQVKQD